MAEPYSITAKVKLSKEAFQRYLHAKSASREDYDDYVSMNRTITESWLKEIRKSEGKDLNKDTNADYFARVLSDILDIPLNDIFIFKYLDKEQCFFYFRLINHDWNVFLRSELTALREISKYKDLETKDYIVVSNYPYADGFHNKFAIAEIIPGKSYFIKNTTDIKKTTDEYAAFINKYCDQINKKYKELVVAEYFEDKSFIENKIKNKYLQLLKKNKKTPGNSKKKERPKPLKYPYHADNDFAYYYSQKIEGSHGPTFRVLPGTEGAYCIDKNHLYFKNEIIQGADVRNYQLHKNVFVASGFLVFIHGKQVEFVDGKTFQALSYYYFKDKNGIFGRNISPTDEKLNGHSLKIKEADPQSFEVIYDSQDQGYSIGGYGPNGDYAYAKDKNNVYLRNTILKKGLFKIVDPFYFQHKGKDYFVDNENAYYRDTLIKDSDAKTFDTNLPFHFAKDKNHVYYCGKPLSDVDMKTFIIFPESVYSKDKNKVFFMDEIIPDIDITSFEVLGWNKAKDKISEIYNGKRIKS